MGAAGTEAADREQIWAKSNMHVWELPTFDFIERTPSERAAIIRRAGLSRYAYLSQADPVGLLPDINMSQMDIDAEITAMQAAGIDIVGWYVWLNTHAPEQDENLRQYLAAFARYGIKPDLWLPQSFDGTDPEGPGSFPPPGDEAEVLQSEVDRIARVARMAAESGCRVNLYNHRGWYGMPETQLALLEGLEGLGLPDVGLVYNFSHAKSPHHDDFPNFERTWPRLRQNVRVINLQVFFPQHAKMMRVVQDSGWRGSVGVIPGPGDAERSLASSLWNIEWAVKWARGRSKTTWPIYWPEPTDAGAS